MTNLENAVLAKLAPEFKREKIQPGQYHVDFSVHVAGDVSVGEDQKVTPTAELSMYGVLVLALLESGVDPDDVLRLIERVARRALKKGVAFNTQLAEQARELIESIRKRFAEKLPKVDRAGAIKLEVNIERS